MKEESVFEQFIREKVENIRLRPSEHVWNTVLNSISEKYTPLFHPLQILFWGIIFLNIYIPLGEMPAIRYTPPQELSSSAAAAGERRLYKKTNAELATIYRTMVPEIKENDQELSYGSRSPLFQSVYIKERKPTVPHLSSFIMEPGPSKNLLLQPVSVTGMVSATVPLADKIDKEKKLIDRLKEKLNLSDPRNGLQFYFTPSVSYRILYIDNKPYFKNNGKGLESSVSHYPSTGLEAGVALLRTVSKRWRIKGGIQMNFSRYNINATKSAPELVYVSLSQNSGFERNTNIRNGNGLLPKKLMNENLQVSLPVGVEFMAAGNDKLSFNVGGTLQPSVSLYAGGYMVTTNYKNYIPAENIFRRYNLQTGIECFIKTNLGLIDLQAGPQVRYQLLSNTLGSYPIREHLIDYGFKIGIVKKIQ